MYRQVEKGGAIGIRDLTPQQYEIALLVCEYLTNQEIADRLGVSPRTVKGQLDTIRIKLGVEKKRDIPDALVANGLYTKGR